MDLADQFVVGRTVSFQEVHDAIWPVYNVRHHGAVGDGVADDRPAIQALLDMLMGAGGGTIYFPPGAYSVSIDPAADYALLLRGANIRLLGHAREDCTIRLADGQPPYGHLLWQDYQFPAHNLSIENLTFDQNRANNPVPSPSGLAENPRTAIGVWTGDNITVRKCRFTHFDARNNIMLSGAMSNLAVVGCQFDDINGGLAEYNDYSAIYLRVHSGGRGIRVLGNSFDAGSPRRPSAMTAIETHGDDQIVRDNSIRDLRTGIIITGERTTGTEMVTVADNHICGCEYGVSVWGMYRPDLGFTSGPGMRSVHTSGNQIVVDMDQWCGIRNSTSGYGIGTYYGNDAPIHDWLMDDNIVRFLPYTNPDVHSWACCAVLATHEAPPEPDRNWFITHNIFTDIPGEPVRIDPVVTNLTVVNNMIG